MRIHRGMATLITTFSLVLAGASASPASSSEAAPPIAPVAASVKARLPGVGTTIFAKNRLLVSEYGYAHPSSTFVLGQHNPNAAYRAMVRRGNKLKQRGEKVLPVYDLVATIADADPGEDGNYNHDLLHSKVQEYIDAAHRNSALLILDLQPGREDFLTVAKRWRWALEDPRVGLALDTEWRMKPGQVPGTDIGSVSAKEINKTSAWLARLVKDGGLPQKLFLFHQYRAGNVRKIQQVVNRKQLATVQSIDASGSPAAKQATYRALARPEAFAPGWMVFTKTDAPIMGPAAIRKVTPPVKMVSYQ